MSAIKFTVDSTCDLSAEIIKELDLGVQNFIVSLGDKTYRDGLTVVPEQIFEFVEKHKVLPKTAAPSPEDYSELFSKYAADYDNIIHFSISGGMSAGNQNARIAAQNFSNVQIIDSLSLSTGTSLLVLKADKLRKEGKSAAEIAAQINAAKLRVQASFVVDTLEYLHKGGRCSGVARLAASMFKIHPMLLVKSGAICVHKKLRGKINEIYGDYAEILKAEFPTPESDFAFITSSGCSDEVVAKFKEKVESLYSFKKIYITKAGCTVSCHCGKGTLGLLFINDGNII